MGLARDYLFDKEPELYLVKAKLSDDGKKRLRISLGIWALVSIVYLWTIWLLYVYWVFQIPQADFTRSYTAVTITIFAIITVAFVVEALINTAQKEWWQEVKPSQEGE